MIFLAIILTIFVLSKRKLSIFNVDDFLLLCDKFLDYIVSRKKCHYTWFALCITKNFHPLTYLGNHKRYQYETNAAILKHTLYISRVFKGSQRSVSKLTNNSSDPTPIAARIPSLR